MDTDECIVSFKREGKWRFACESNCEVRLECLQCPLKSKSSSWGKVAQFEFIPHTVNPMKFEQNVNFREF